MIATTTALFILAALMTASLIIANEGTGGRLALSLLR